MGVRTTSEAAIELGQITTSVPMYQTTPYGLRFVPMGTVENMGMSAPMAQQQPQHVPMQQQQQSPSIASRGTMAVSQGLHSEAAIYVFDPGPLGFALQETSSGIRILSVQPGSAAFQKGVQTGAAMLTVGRLDVRHKTKAEVTKLLKELPRPLTIQMEAIATCLLYTSPSPRD